MNRDDIQTIFDDAEKAFEQSDIKLYAEKHYFKWFYSISSTRLTENGIVIVGFNYGAEQEENYSPQKELPDVNFADLYKNNSLGSFQRIYPFMKPYFDENEINDSVQMNFCFFRSSNEKQITSKDISLSVPLFLSLLKIIKPTHIICFSAKMRDYLLSKNLCSDIESRNISMNNKTLFIVKGKYKIDMEKILIYFLPHPNARVTTEARKESWDFCFGAK